ncbi:hypothetical protein AMTRI_Chr05g73970 [Amborella trichopoda]
MDESWGFRPGRGNLCPICSTQHFPFCSQHHGFNHSHMIREPHPMHVANNMQNPNPFNGPKPVFNPHGHDYNSMMPGFENRTGSILSVPPHYNNQPSRMVPYFHNEIRAAPGPFHHEIHAGSSLPESYMMKPKEHLRQAEYRYSGPSNFNQGGGDMFHRSESRFANGFLEREGNLQSGVGFRGPQGLNPSETDVVPGPNMQSRNALVDPLMGVRLYGEEAFPERFPKKMKIENLGSFPPTPESNNLRPLESYGQGMIKFEQDSLHFNRYHRAHSGHIGNSDPLRQPPFHYGKEGLFDSRIPMNVVERDKHLGTRVNESTENQSLNCDDGGVFGSDYNFRGNVYHWSDKVEHRRSSGVGLPHESIGGVPPNMNQFNPMHFTSSSIKLPPKQLGVLDNCFSGGSVFSSQDPSTQNRVYDGHHFPLRHQLHDSHQIPSSHHYSEGAFYDMQNENTQDDHGNQSEKGEYNISSDAYIRVHSGMESMRSGENLTVFSSRQNHDPVGSHQEEENYHKWGRLDPSLLVRQYGNMEQQQYWPSRTVDHTSQDHEKHQTQNDQGQQPPGPQNLGQLPLNNSEQPISNSYWHEQNLQQLRPHLPGEDHQHHLSMEIRQHSSRSPLPTHEMQNLQAVPSDFTGEDKRFGASTHNTNHQMEHPQPSSVTRALEPRHIHGIESSDAQNNNRQRDLSVMPKGHAMTSHIRASQMFHSPQSFSQPQSLGEYPPTLFRSQGHAPASAPSPNFIAPKSTSVAFHSSLAQSANVFSDAQFPPGACSFPQPVDNAASGFPLEGSQTSHQAPLKQFIDNARPFDSKLTQSDKPKFVDASLLFKHPHRSTRPDHFVIILRGLPGSGKSYVAKALRDLEVANGGKAPRIHSMDDYFMTEVEKVEEVDGSKSSSSVKSKKRVTRKVMEYCYEPEMEEAYRASMLKAFKKTLEEGIFTFIIVDDRNLRVGDFALFWATAKGCAARNIHGFTLDAVQKMADQWEQAPPLYLQLDAQSLFSGDDLNEHDIQEVEMDSEDPSCPEEIASEEHKAELHVTPESPSEDENPSGLYKFGVRWGTDKLDKSDSLHEVGELGKSKWSESDDAVKLPKMANPRKEKQGNALSGLIQAYGKGEKSVHWGDQIGKGGFSIGGGKKPSSRCLIIGPGAGYNSDSNPLIEDDETEATDASNPAMARKHTAFLEHLKAEKESFRAVFDRRQRIGLIDAEED